MKKIITRILLGLFIVWFLVLCINIYRTGKDLKPILCVCTALYQDGGSAVFYNLGYKVNYYYYMNTIDKNGNFRPDFSISKMGFYNLAFDHDKYDPSRVIYMGK